MGGRGDGTFLGGIPPRPRRSAPMTLERASSRSYRRTQSSLREQCRCPATSTMLRRLTRTTLVNNRSGCTSTLSAIQATNQHTMHFPVDFLPTKGLPR